MSTWRDNVRNVEPYTPGEQPKEEGVIKLNTNENPYPPSPRVMEAMADIKNLRKYPDPAATDLVEAIAKYYGFSKEECLKAIDYYHEYFSEKGLYENEVYLGVPDLLASLKQAGKQQIVATSKPEEFSIQILKHFCLYDYFYFVAGATKDRKRSKKSYVIKYALEQNGITDLAHTIMIGDREHDVLGAQAQKLDSIGVLYGFGSREELEEAGATYIAQEVGEIAAFIG